MKSEQSKESKAEQRLAACYAQIKYILDLYNCSLETDIYHSVWLSDLKTGKIKNI